MLRPITLGKSGFALFLALTISTISAQAGDEEAIKKTIRAETEAFYSRNAAAWEATWLHETNTTRTMVANNSYSAVKGWANFGPEIVKALKDANPFPIELKSDNYIIRRDENLAWVEYDQYMNLTNGDPKDRRFSREYRVLVRQDGAWKIASQITHDPDTFKPNPQSIESTLNNTGYNLIGLKKAKDAIEVFQLNVRLNPDSANCYDSLGEAYALDGDLAQAIKNYEKAIALDPSREGSKAALAKLKK
ncbi:MAG: tetratricopeptide repeat protein [Limisphaerales bacterium]